MLAFHGYERRRAWAAWHGGLVTNGSIRDFTMLLPDPDVIAAAEDATDRQNEHAFLMWFAAVGGFDEQEKGTDDGG